MAPEVIDLADGDPAIDTKAETIDLDQQTQHGQFSLSHRLRLFQPRRSAQTAHPVKYLNAIAMPQQLNFKTEI